MNSDENTNLHTHTHPRNPYAPEPGEQAPNQYGQYVTATEATAQPTNSEQNYGPNGAYNYSQNTTANSETTSTTNSSSSSQHRNLPPTRLSVDVVAPTHFDDEVPATEQVVTTTNTTNASAPNPTDKQPFMRFIPFIVSSALTLIFLVIAVWAVSTMGAKDAEISAMQQTIDNQASIIGVIEAQTGTTINNPDDVPSAVAMDDYIYINEWGIKLHIPEGLVHISFILNQNYRQVICFNGLQAGSVAFPAFADVRQNPGGMGCLLRVANEEGDINSATNTKFGTKVFTADGYSYFYIAPTSLYSTDPAEQGLENTAVQLVKTMLSGDNISTY